MSRSPPTELADHTGLDERWVREWAYNQAAAKLIAVDADADARAVLADTGGRGGARDARPSGIRDGHVPSVPPDDGGTRGDARELPHRAGSRLRQPRRRRRGRHRTELRAVESSPPDPDGAPGARRHRRAAAGGDHRRRHRMRRRGSGAADGRSVPAEHASSATTSRSMRSIVPSIADARTTPTNVRFVDPRVEPLPDDHSVDFVTTFDCIHDMTHPQQMIDAIGAALAPRRHVAARRHQGARHVRRERRRRTRWRR